MAHQHLYLELLPRRLVTGVSIRVWYGNGGAPGEDGGARYAGNARPHALAIISSRPRRRAQPLVRQGCSVTLGADRLLGGLVAVPPDGYLVVALTVTPVPALRQRHGVPAFGTGRSSTGHSIRMITLVVQWGHQPSGVVLNDWRWATLTRERVENDMMDDPKPTVEDVRRLAGYFLAPRFSDSGLVPDGVVRPQDVHLLVGEVPSNLPDDVPIFPTGTVEGTLLAGDRMIVLIVTDRSPEDVIAWYRDRFTRAGWIEPPPPYLSREDGFTRTWSWDAEEDGSEVTFCRTKDGPSACVVAEPEGDGTTVVELRVNLSTDPRESPYRAAERIHEHLEFHDPDPFHVSIPVIRPPAEARQSPESSERGNGSESQRGTLKSELELKALAAHYDGQLATGGWTRRDGAVADGAAWSRWTFQPPAGKNGTGYLFIVRRGDEKRYDLHVRSFWEPGEDEERGWPTVEDW